jgi:threonyl-tRNA synthetase
MESHQDLGNRLELFFIDETSPGSIFWKPRGAALFNNLIKIIRDLYDIYGYVEVVSPNIYDKKLWEVSGHWDKYKENMFILEDIHGCTYDQKENSDQKKQTDEIQDPDPTPVLALAQTQVFSIKPMSCPGHCLIFKNMHPMSKSLPIRMAEFAVLHRNEASGALHGLTRVRRFQQDDAHIFCRMDQIHQEVMDTLRMVQRVYDLFGLEYTIKLSTRPEKYIGTIEIWNQAEQILERAIEEFSGGKKVKKNIGDGAFYGPKIDITLVDKFKRAIQCGTIQLDFNLPSEERFNLKYVDENNHLHYHPVIIHRAVLGSVERFIGIILEHTQGHLPIQVSPYPIIIVTVHKEYNASAENLKSWIQGEMRRRNTKLNVDLDISSEDIRYKIKSAERKGYCYIVTVGQREATAIETNIMDAEIAVRIDKKIQSFTTIKLIEMMENGLKLV